ncbi:MAG TPA: RidA family protein [Methanothrix sp.]|nr:RidA family protein [Methanothrix sp.]HPJ83898.1 RidA family protein [Methanothrix sp.]
MRDSARGEVQHINPEGLPKSPAFTNVVVVTGPVKTIYVGGQDAVDASGNIVGKGDIGRQTEQVMANIQTALEAAGADLADVVKWNVYVVAGQPLQPGFEAFRKVWGQRPNPPAITAAIVSGLARPEFLVEMDAVAVVAE